MLNWPPNFWLLVFLIHSGCYSLTTATQPPFWISEVYNSFYNFTDAFVEIYDGGRGNVTLLDINLELEIQNNETLTISLHNMTTNYGGFLVLSFENADEPTKKLLKNIQNETVMLKLTIPGKTNDTQVIDAFKKEKGWSDVISCFRNESAINSIVLVGEDPSEGERNNCPLSPARLDLLMFRSPFNLTLQLLSHGIDHFSLANHIINFFEDNALIQTFSLGNYYMQNTKVNVSLPINRSFDVNSTYTINLELQIAKEMFVVLESVYFGAQDDSGIPLNQTFKTYPDTNAAQWVSPVYLQLVPSKSNNFASCHCEVSSSTNNLFVKVDSFNLRYKNCEKKCNELIMKPAAPGNNESVTKKNNGTAASVTPNGTAASVTPNVTAPSVTPNVTAPSVTPNGTAPSVTPNGTAPSVTPNGTAPSVTPNGTAPSVTPNGTAPSVSPNATAPSVTPNGTAPSVTPNGTAPSVTPNGTAPSVTPNGTAPSVTPNGTAPSVTSNGTTSSVLPKGTASPISPNGTEPLITTNRDSPATVTPKDGTTSLPNTIYSMVTNLNDYTDLNSHTSTSGSLSTNGYSSLVTETTVKSTATIPSTIENASSTKLETSTRISNFSDSTHQKFVTSTVSITTQMTSLPLHINEVKVGLQSSMDHWIELKGNESFATVSSYQLVLSVAGQTKSSKFSLEKLKTTNKEGFLIINFKTPGAGQLLKDLNSKAGVLQLFDKGVHADCVAYQIEGTELDTTLIKTCHLQTVKQITVREVKQNWTISRCGREFEVLEPSAGQSNKCPTQKFSRNVYMKILERQLTTNFKTYFLSSLVQKLTSEEGCMLSASFFLKFEAFNSGKDLNIHSILAAPDQTKLNAVYMCFKHLFYRKPVTFHLGSGSETVSVHRCYNSSYIIPTFKVSAVTMSRTNQIVAFVIAAVVVFVCIVGGFILYLRHKKKSLLGVLGMARYDADQDDLLVNMEDVGRLDTNFRNPTYSQLSAY